MSRPFIAYFVDGPLKGERRKFNTNPLDEIKIPLAPEIHVQWLQPIPDELITPLPVGIYSYHGRRGLDEYNYRFSGVRLS